MVVEVETALEKLQTHIREEVRPGLPERMSEAASVGDGIWQGDLGLEVVAKVPAGYVVANNPSTQLVLGDTQGARHCLDSLDGVTLYHPVGWNLESLVGPCFVLKKERTVNHPVHGAVTIPAGFTILCRYQREMDKEQARRSRD